jgi:hypothetical protein
VKEEAFDLVARLLRVVRRTRALHLAHFPPEAASAGLGGEYRCGGDWHGVVPPFETNSGLGGIKILNHPAPPTFRKSVKVGEQNLYSRANELVGDRDPRAYEFVGGSEKRGHFGAFGAEVARSLPE